MYLVATALTTFLASMFIFIGKAAIVGANVFLFKVCLENVTKENEELNSQFGPTLVVTIITYIFASMFIGMFDESVNALLISFAIDANANDG